MQRSLTVTEVAKHLSLDWKTVKNIDKFYLEGQYGQPNLDGLRILAVDEISVKKGHRYLTVVMDYLSGRVVFVGKDRKAKTLMRFFNQMSAGQRKSIEAVAMDMWDPYIKAVKKNCPTPKSSLICSMWWPNLTRSLIKYETANTVRPRQKTRPFLKVPNTCC
jgi:transposase